MTIFKVKLPDVGEGVAEAELIAWRINVGDDVSPDSVLAEVMTDKATVEISSPVSGRVTFLQGQPGDVLAVGSEIVGIETDGSEIAETTETTETTETEPVTAVSVTADASRKPRVTAAAAVRARASSLGIDLAAISGTGPDARVTHSDLDRYLGGVTPARTSNQSHSEPIRGLRRRIAERLTSAWSEIPHITYVEEIDATAIEELRSELNSRERPDNARLTLLPFIVQALVIACREQPILNAHYETTTRMLSTFDAVHVGIATQTPGGLMVPVVHHAQGRGLWNIAAEITRLVSAAREGRATQAELSGSTITITSLGALGGVMTTPIINQPEVAVIGVNKMDIKPVWRDGMFVPRSMFNLSSSFDHRVIDGWDAAVFVQRLKALLEMPALLFLDEEEQLETPT